MTKELRAMIAPRWCEEQNGVYVPLIGKVLEADNLAEEAVCYQDIMNLAREKWKQVATKAELFQLFLQKDEINEILAEHGCNVLTGWFCASDHDDEAEMLYPQLIDQPFAFNFDHGMSGYWLPAQKFKARAVAPATALGEIRRLFCIKTCIK